MIKDYQNIMAVAIEAGKAKNNMLREIDKLWNCEWELPEGLAGKDWVRAFRLTGPHDAMFAAARTFSDKDPFIDIQPLSPIDKENAESIETVLKWHLSRAKRRAPKDPIYEIMVNAVKYSEVAFQVLYLPHELKRPGSRLKTISGGGDFAFRVHNPQNVYAKYSDYGLEGVGVTSLMTASSVANMFDKDNKGVIAMKKKISSGLAKGESLESVMDDTWISYFDYTNHEDRGIWGTISNNKLVVETADPDFVFMDEPHDLNFFPWVYRKDDHPLMKPVIDAGLYGNACTLATLRYYITITRVAQAGSWSKTASGEGVEVDYTDPGGQVKLRHGDEFGVLQPAQIDPNINMLIESVNADIRQATVAEALTTIEKFAGGGTPFSTVNAILQAAISSLSPITKLGEAALEDGLYQMLHWIKKSGKMTIGYRTSDKNRDNPEQSIGAQVVIDPEQIDPDNTYIKVTLQADTPSDKQQRINMANEMLNLGVTPQYAMETNGIDFTEQNYNDFLEWKYAQAEVEADVQRIMMQPQLEVQQMQIQQQQQAEAQLQQQTAQQEMQSANAQAFEQTRGRSSVGNPPIQSVPGMGREQITGETMGAG